MMIIADYAIYQLLKENVQNFTLTLPSQFM